jgi:hypothetical protein
MVQKIEGGQRDFSYGEIDIALKRNDDHPARKGGLRQMANTRILNSGAIQNRSGRRALFPITSGLTRIEKFTISAGNNYKIGFGPGILQIVSEAGAVVASFKNQGNGAALPWVSASDIQSIVFVPFSLSVYITFGHSMRPQVVTWNGVSTWTIADYDELVIGNQKRTAFYRIAPQNIVITPSAQTGSITISASSDAFEPGIVGARIRFVERQILVTGYTGPQVIAGTVEETLPGSQVLLFVNDPRKIFSLGDEVIGATSGSKGLITALDGSSITVQLLSTQTSTFTTFTGSSNTVAFVSSELCVGPSGSESIQTANSVGNPTGCSVWDEEVMNDYRGYPASCFVDQFRLGLCNFSGVPGGIAWSAIDSPTDLFVDASGDNAIFEIVPANAQVLYVAPGAESSEFVFCDTKLYYIPISPSSPLVPGSVSFQILSGDGCAQVQPRLAQDVLLYANAGANSLMAIVATGAFNKPFAAKNLSEYHSHLFSGITTIAVPTADAQFNERYAYVLNSNGSLVVGKYNLGDLGSGSKIGWGPWSGVGVVQWVSAWNGDVFFTSNYFGADICEQLDDTLYLDCGLSVNSPPAPFAPPAGKGPLWFIPSQSVILMDQNTRPMGTYQVDANGNIIPQFNGGENLSIASLVAGQPWTMTAEPFCPDASPGGDVGQRMFRRRISRFAAYVVNSTGFRMARLFSGPITPNSPSLGAIMNERIIPAYNVGDDATKPPPLREIAERWRPIGKAFDPRAAIIKDTPGPLLIEELGMEATI